MNTTTLFNPCCYGKVTRLELAENDSPYIRNKLSDELKEFVNEKFNITSDMWHIEEGEEDNLFIIDNANNVVSRNG